MQNETPLAAEIEQAQAGLRDSIEIARRLSEQSQHLLDRSWVGEQGGSVEA